MFIYMHALSFLFYAFVCLHSNQCHVILRCQYRHEDYYIPPFLFFFAHIRQPLLFGLSTAQSQCTFFLITFCCCFFSFTFVFHIPTTSCWLTVCLSVVQILIFHVCSFFDTYTSCIQRLYKGQFKILQSYFGFHYKMSLAVQYKILNTVRVHVHLSQVIS